MGSWRAPSPDGAKGGSCAVRHRASLDCGAHDRARISSGFYAPLSVLVTGNEGGGATFEYDRPSTLFQQFDDASVLELARDLDSKLAALILRVAFGE